VGFALYVAERGAGLFGLLPGDSVDPLEGHGDEPRVVVGFVALFSHQVVQAGVEAWWFRDGQELGYQFVVWRVRSCAGVEEAAVVVVDAYLGEEAVEVSAGEGEQFRIEV